MSGKDPKKKEILLETGTNELEILEFYINEFQEGSDKAEPCHFGVNVAKVMQVIESPNLTPPESAPHPCFLGMIPLRDLILPVIDLSLWLGLKRALDAHEVVIVTEFSQSVTGFLVSGVTEIHRVGWQQVEPPSGYLGRMDTSCIIGMVNLQDHFIQLLDLEHILTDLTPKIMERAKIDTVRADREYVVLLADDSATIRKMLQANLEAANFKPVLVTNGEEALNYLLATKARVEQEGTHINDYLDLVISDIEMPQMDGFSLTKNIKQDPVLKDLPVILYSSIITKELRHKGESVGADDQVAKPEMNKMAEKALTLIKARGR